MGASALVCLVALKPVTMNSWVRALVVLVPFAVTLAGCGHPYTSVYVENLDQVQYCVTLVQGSGPGDQTAVLVGAGARGVLLTDPGETAGTVELRQVDGPVTDRGQITPGRPNLIQIEAGRLRFDDQADLSNRPSGDFDSAAVCG